jgi:hypothetical protein
MRLMAVLTIVLASYGLARAQGSTQADPAKADAAFEEAQKLKEAGKVTEACGKYREALQFNTSAVGTMLNVALCDEQDNQVASALNLFTQARDLAREHNMNEHRSAAEEHIAKLEPLVPHLAVAFAELLPETKLVIDDKVYPTDNASDIRVDPGTRHITVSAPGRLGYETNVDVKASEHKAIAIPKLKPPVTVKKARKTVGMIVTFSGVALIGTGVVLGYVAKGDYNDQFAGAMPNCTKADPKPQCNPDGYQKTGNARTLGNVGTVVGITGGVALGLGAYLWFFAPKEQSETPHAVSVIPTVSPDGAGFAAIGHF